MLIASYSSILTVLGMRRACSKNACESPTAEGIRRYGRVFGALQFAHISTRLYQSRTWASSSILSGSSVTLGTSDLCHMFAEYR